MQCELIDIKELSSRENDIMKLNVAGLLLKEMADHIDRADDTVKKTMCNIKAKVGLHKDKELVAWYFCRMMDVDFAEFKKQILSAVMVVFLFFAEYSMQGMFAKTMQRQVSLRACVHRGRRRDDEYNFLAA